MTFTETLIDELAKYLAENPNAAHPLTFKPTGDYADTETGIYAITAPLKRDRRSVVIAPFPGEDDPAYGDSVVSIQLDFYGTRREVTRMIDDAFDRLQGFYDGRIGPIDVQGIDRTSGANLGLDEAGNLRRTENYDLAVYRPSSHRL